MLKRPTANDGKMAEVGTTDKRVFIKLNCLPPDYKNTRKFLDVALIKLLCCGHYKTFFYVSQLH